MHTLVSPHKRLKASIKCRAALGVRIFKDSKNQIALEIAKRVKLYYGTSTAVALMG
jgi:hypothetical protein